MILMPEALAALPIPGSRVGDPTIPELQISGLSIAQAVVGNPIKLIFTATNTGQGVGLSFHDAFDTFTGCVVTPDGIIVAMLDAVEIGVGPFASPQVVPLNLSDFFSLESIGTLTSQWAGGSVSGSLLTAYVGTQQYFNAYGVGDSFAPQLNVMLLATIRATGQALPLPGSGGTGSPGGGGGGAPSPSGQPPGSTTPPPPGGTTGSTGAGGAKATPAISTTEIVLGALGLAGLIGGSFFLATR